MLSTLCYCEKNAPRPVIKLKKSQLSAIWRVLRVSHPRQLCQTVETKRPLVSSCTSLAATQVLSGICSIWRCLPNWGFIAFIELVVVLVSRGMFHNAFCMFTRKNSIGYMGMVPERFLWRLRGSLRGSLFPKSSEVGERFESLLQEICENRGYSQTSTFRANSFPSSYIIPSQALGRLSSVYH